MASQKLNTHKGKYQVLKDIFRQNGGFGYGAFGYKGDNNGFSQDEENYGFNEISLAEVDGYEERPPLKLYNETSNITVENDKVVIEFEIELDTNMLIPKYGSSLDYQPINQIAIVNNSETGAIDTDFLSLSTIQELQKTADIGLSFIVRVRM